MFSPGSFIILGLTLRFMIQLELIFVCGLSVGLRLISCIWLSSHPSTVCWRLSFLPSFPGGSDGKESACNTGDLGSIPGLGRSPGEEKGYPLQYSGLENSMDCIVNGDAKSRTRLNDSHFDFPQPGIEPMLLAVEAWSFNPWTTREVPHIVLTIATY